MQIKMDTDAVRSMASKFRQTADSMDTSLASIKATVESAGWQSQAREEFIMRLELLQRTSTQSATVLRMMAQAADRKAEQWEAIANIFNGPFQYLGNIWSSVIAFFSGIGSSIWNAITSIQLPSLPNWVLPPISVIPIVGSFPGIVPEWFKKPPWWPFNKKNEEKTTNIENHEEDNVDGIHEDENENADYSPKYNGSTPAKGTETKPWNDIDPPLTNGEGNRNPEIYDDVLNQFAVEENSRYRKNQQGKNETYCNIFVWDATKAMGAEIPHWVDSKGNPVPQGTGRELSANGTINWLETHGSENGWKVLTAEQAQAMANEGHPVVASWENPNSSKPGHVAMVRPGEYSQESGPALAQAGWNNDNNTTVSEAFGDREVVYYYHE
ncbi:MAG: WXG100 family type VII secretion target [Anaerolineaceae bacterium]|nr:WXG100 family type VII secretion target [Anaerolineaceae bacterium]